MVKGKLQEKNGYYYILITIAAKQRKWISTGLKTKGNKKKAESMLMEILTKYNVKTYNSPKTNINTNKMDMLELCEKWFEHKKDIVKDTTLSGYIAALKSRILPYFKEHNLLVCEITSKALLNYFETLTKAGLSPKTISNHRGILNNMMKYAMQHEIIEKNPMALLEPSKQKRKIFDYYTLEEMKELLKSVNNKQMEFPVTLACLYGFRRSEICGLKWSDIDFVRNHIHIRNTVVQVQTVDGKFQVRERDNTTKNGSERIYPILPLAMELLLKMQKQQEELGIYKKDGYIYVRENGELIKPDIISHNFPKHLQKYGFRHIRFHDLRHSCASALLADPRREISLKDIQYWLGHDNFQSTLRYAHIADVIAKEHTAKKMNQLFLT